MRRDPAVRHRWGLLVLTALLVPLPALDSLVPLAAVMFLAGLAISPTLIAAATWVATLVPPSRLNEGMALYSTGLIAGVASAVRSSCGEISSWSVRPGQTRHSANEFQLARASTFLAKRLATRPETRR